MDNESAIRISTGSGSPFDIFVTSDDEIYVDNSQNEYRVGKWRLNETNSTNVMRFSSQCYSLFIDVNNTLYCSSDIIHTVVKMSLIAGTNSTITVAAGNGTEGS